MRKKVLHIVFAGFVFLGSSLLYGFENIIIHPAITKAAIGRREN
jgi:hypothetical protein